MYYEVKKLCQKTIRKMICRTNLIETMTPRIEPMRTPARIRLIETTQRIREITPPNTNTFMGHFLMTLHIYNNI